MGLHPVGGVCHCRGERRAERFEEPLYAARLRDVGRVGGDVSERRTGIFPVLLVLFDAVWFLTGLLFAGFAFCVADDRDLGNWCDICIFVPITLTSISHERKEIPHRHPEF